MVHQNKAKVRKYASKRVLGTAARLTIFSKYSTNKNKLGRNSDGHVKEKS